MKPEECHSDAPGAVEQLADRFRESGALWLRSVFPQEQIKVLREAYADRYLSKSRSKLTRRYAKVGDRRFMITIKLKPPFDSPSLYANEAMTPLLDALLGSQHLISSFGSVVAFPGADGQDVHFDYPPLYESEQTCASLPPYAITMVVPLIDLDEQTGGTEIWEGSHASVGAREQLSRLASGGSRVGSSLPLAAAGDVYLMDYRLIHAGTPNRSDRARPILYVVYSRPWFCEEMNFAEQPAIRISAQRLAAVPNEHRHLFLYAEKRG